MNQIQEEISRLEVLVKENAKALHQSKKTAAHLRKIILQITQEGERKNSAG